MIKLMNNINIKTGFTAVCNAAELFTGKRAKAGAFILKKLIKHIKSSGQQKIHKKSKNKKNGFVDLGHPEAQEVNEPKGEVMLMLIDDNEVKNIDNENLENERREMAIANH